MCAKAGALASSTGKLQENRLRWHSLSHHPQVWIRHIRLQPRCANVLRPGQSVHAKQLSPKNSKNINIFESFNLLKRNTPKQLLCWITTCNLVVWGSMFHCNFVGNMQVDVARPLLTWSFVSMRVWGYNSSLVYNMFNMISDLFSLFFNEKSWGPRFGELGAASGPKLWGSYVFWPKHKTLVQRIPSLHQLVLHFIAFVYASHLHICICILYSTINTYMQILTYYLCIWKYYTDCLFHTEIQTNSPFLKGLKVTWRADTRDMQGRLQPKGHLAKTLPKKTHQIKFHIFHCWTWNLSFVEFGVQQLTCSKIFFMFQHVFLLPKNVNRMLVPSAMPFMPFCISSSTEITWC